MQSIINSSKIDSVVFNTTKQLYYYYLDIHNRDKFKQLGERMIALGKKANNYYYQGTGYRIIGDYYHYQEIETKATESFLRAIELLNKTTKWEALCTAYTNLGGVYHSVEKFSEAEAVFKKALSILKTHNIKDIDQITTINNNLGICAAETGNVELARYYFKNSLEQWQSINDQEGIGYGYNNLAILYNSFKEYDSALVYAKKALEVKLKYHSRDQKLHAYSSIAAIYVEMNDYKKANEEMREGEKYIDSTSKDEYVELFYRNSAEIYYKLKDYKNSAIYMEKYAKRLQEKVDEGSASGVGMAQKSYADSLINAGEKQIQDLKIENQKAELDKDKQQKIFLSIGLVIVLLSGLMFYNRYKITKRQKEIIEQQKNVVEEQKKEIVDSINYANRIQNAVLTDASVWQSISANHFILFKPKDIVSGDFYWAHQVKNKDIWAVADCTGHGVPGAFMSMLANSLLNEIVVEFKVNNAGEILDRLRTKIIAALSKENNQQNDGMDIALCVYDRISGELEFSGANNNALLVRDNVIKELKGDKMPVGKYHGEEKQFTSTRIKLEPNDIIYMYTDGFADQFGGPKGKKFRYKQLDELLLANHKKDMDTQRQILEQTHLQWKGDLLQTDDICVVGMKLT